MFFTKNKPVKISVTFMNVKKLLLIFGVCSSTISYAQVGIGTTTPNSSTMLDVVATNKGVLLPRVELTSSTDATTIVPHNEVGLLVYNTTATADIGVGYHFWDGAKWVAMRDEGLLTGVGNPNTNGTTGGAGAVYVDESTGDIYVHNGTTWVSASAQETLTSITHDSNTGTITYADENGNDTVLDLNTLVDNAETVTTITADPVAGTITYTDENGNDTVLDLNTLVVNEETVTTLVNNGDGTYTYTNEDGKTTTFDVTQTAVGDPNTNGTIGTAGDVYVDESTGDVYTHNGTTWVNQTHINANNGLTATGNLIQLGGDLIQPTIIGTDATNTLAVTGLQDADMTTNDYDIMVVNKTTAVLEKTDVSELRPRQYTASYTAARGDFEFDTPQNIIELENIDAYRNGARIDFVQVDANTIKLDLAETGGCYNGDEIRIVQLK